MSTREMYRRCLLDVRAAKKKSNTATTWYSQRAARYEYQKLIISAEYWREQLKRERNH